MLKHLLSKFLILLVAAFVITLGISYFSVAYTKTIFQYTVTDLGVLPGYIKSVPTSINDRGQVVGNAETSSGSSRGFLWQNNQMINLGTLNGADNSYATDINNKGQVVGNSGNAAFLWQNNKMTNLGILDGSNSSKAVAINNSGQVVGNSPSDDIVANTIFLWQNGVMSRVPIKKNSSDDFTRLSVFNASDINDSGKIASTSIFRSIFSVILINGNNGNSTGSSGGSYNLYSSLGMPPKVNKSGDMIFNVVPNSFGSAAPQPFLSKNGKTIKLASLGGNGWDKANGINDRGKVVGTSKTAGTISAPYHAVVWYQNKITDLNSLLPANSGWELTEALAINNKGQIVGVEKYKGQQDRAFLLTPTWVTQ